MYGNGKPVIVVGAGPAGLLTSLFIRNREVLILEEHREVGKPKHCAGFTGLDTARRLIKTAGWSVVENSYKVLVFYTPKGRYRLAFKTPMIYRINRPLLEEKLLDRVLRIGHRVVFKTKAKPSSRAGYVKALGGELEGSYVIACDGARSIFRAKYCGTYEKHLVGVQHVYRASGLDDDTIHLIFNSATPDFFQWLAPIDYDLVLVGFATHRYSIHPDKIVEYIARTTRVELTTRIESFGGLIPRTKPMDKPVIHNRVVFIGDSVPITKPYTGGGLMPISILAPVLGTSINSGNLEPYLALYRGLLKRVKAEYIATITAEKVGYWIPPYVVYHIYRLSLLSIQDYDKHYKLLLKALAISPYVLPKILS